MNSEIEQRIVAMYFDNKDFEKNAQQTIGTLGQLKEGLNLEDSVKGFDELEKAGKKLNLNQAKTTVTNLKNALGGLGTAVQKAFNIGTAPLRALDSFFDTFRGYVGKFVGFDLASKFVNAFESALRQLTVAPIEAGWNMYQANIDSVKTIMSGTVQSYSEAMKKTSSDWAYDEAEHMEFVKRHLRDLSDYAAKTVFSLQDMTSNIGKFTNQGVDLETSVMAMEGIANMTAKAGQSAQQASMAMYNFSQAIGVGKMTTIDWKSIENANIGTMELKNNFLRVAAAAGKLKKELDSEGVEKFFYTLDSKGKELARKDWLEVSAENFRDTLKHDWLDKDVMLRVMQLYSGQGFDLDTLASWGFDVKDTELMEELKKIGEEALEAATQVRTFQKMWDALTESVQSSWADSMELIFGDMSEATEFWTELNDKIGGVMDKIGRDRNNLLREWRGQTWDEESQAWIKLDDAVDGREDLIQGIYGIIDAANSLGSAFSAAWSDVFGNITGETLQNITRGFREFVDSFKEWLGDVNDSDSRINKLRSGLSGVFSVLKVIWEVIKTVFGVLKQVVKPLIDPMINLFDKFGQWLKLDNVKNLGDILATLRDRFGQLWTKISGLGWSGVLGKIGEWMGNLWAEIREGVSNFLQENGLGGIVDWFVGIGDSIKAGFDSVVEWWNSDENKISGFFKGIYETVTGWFKTSYDDRGNEIRPPIVQFFYRIRDGVSEAFKAVQEWWQGSGIPQFFAKLWKSISEIFEPKLSGVYYDGTGRHETYTNAPFVQFFVDTWEGIKKAYEDIKGWDIWNTIGGFFSGIWEKLSGIFQPKLVGIDYDGTGRHESYGPSPFAQFFIDTWDGIKAAFEEVKGWEIWKTIGGFFSGVWDTISGLFEPKLVSIDYDSTGRHETYGKSPFAQFFIDTWAGIKAAFEEVKGWEIWKTIGGFFEGVWNTISEMFQPKLVDIQYDGTGRHEFYGDAPIVKFFKDTWEGIKNIFTEVADWWNDPDNAISGFFKGIWDSIMDLINGTGDTADAIGKASETIDAAAPSGQNGEKTGKNLGILGEIIDKIKGFITEVIDKAGGVTIPPQIENFFKGLGDFMLGVANALGTVMGAIGRILGGGEATDADHIGVALGVAGIVLTQILDFIHTRDLGKVNTQTFAQQFMSFSLGLLAMAAAVSLLSTLKPEEMWPAVGALAALGAVVSAILVFVNKLNQTKNEAAPKTGMAERLVSKLIDTLKVVGSIAVIMALLPPVIDAFGKAKSIAPELSGMDILEIMTSVVVAIVGISLGLSLVDKLTGNKGLNVGASFHTALSLVVFIGIVGAVLGTLGAALEGIFGTENVVEAIEQGAEILRTIGEALGGLIGGIASGLIEPIRKALGFKTEEENMDSAMKILDQLASRVEGFTSEKNSGIIRILNAIGMLSQVAKDFPNGNALKEFADQLDPLAQGIMHFGITVNGFNANDGLYGWDTEELYDNIQKTTDIIGMFNRNMGDMGLSKTNAEKFVAGIDYLNQNFTDERFEALGRITAGIVEAFAKAVDVNSPEMTSMSSLLMDNLSKAMKIGLSGDGTYALGAFDATPVVDAIVLALGYGESAIATAVHDMVQNALNDLGGGEDNPLGLVIPDESTLDPILKLLSGDFGDGTGKLFGNMQFDDSMFKSLYGEGGTAENPAQGSVFAQLLGLQSQMEGMEFPNIGEKLADSMKMTDAEGKPLDLVGNLRETLTSFEAELNETTAFEIKIVPTYDFSNLNAETIRAMLSDYPVKIPVGPAAVNGGYNIPETVQMDFTGINAALDLDGLKSRLDNISVAVDANGQAMVDAIGAMGAHIDRISTAISQIQIYVDMYGLIPAIDKELGRRAANSAATGVTSMLNNPYANINVPTKQ